MCGTVDARIEQMAIDAQYHAGLEGQIDRFAVDAHARLVPVLQTNSVWIEGVCERCPEFLDGVVSNPTNFREAKPGAESALNLRPCLNAGVGRIAHLLVRLSKENSASVVALIKGVVADEVDHKSLTFPQLAVCALIHDHVHTPAYRDIAVFSSLREKALPYIYQRAFLSRGSCCCESGVDICRRRRAHERKLSGCFGRPDMKHQVIRGSPGGIRACSLQQGSCVRGIAADGTPAE